MSKYLNKTWIIITIILSAVFAVLFYPVAAERVGTLKALVFTMIGLLVIWLVYLIRAHIFSKILSKRNKKGQK
jgi:hypothetical protein